MADASSQTRVHGFVEGLVQGVGYRYSMQGEANRLGLAGWVRNLPDSRVEFEAEGSREAVQSLVDWAHGGPSHASVERVETEERPIESGAGGFDIRH